MKFACKAGRAVLLMILLIFALSSCGKSAGESGSEAQPQSDEGTNQIRHIYLAGPFFNEAEIENVEYVESVLTEKGFSYFSPMRHTVDAETGTTEWAHEIFEMDRSEIGKADAVVALYYGSYGDTGTAWECGYAAAAGIPVILVHVSEEGNSNLMMHCGCTTNVFLKDLAEYDFDTMPVYEFEGAMY